MRLKDGLKLLEYARMFKAGEMVSYKFLVRNIVELGDYASLFDMILFLCDHSVLFSYKYVFNHAIKINNYNFQKVQERCDEPCTSFIIM